jgi:cell wall-associated NlpC family hydrolase
VDPQEAPALSALARQLTPQADERGLLPLRALTAPSYAKVGLSATIAALLSVAAPAAGDAWAAPAGGTAAAPASSGHAKGSDHRRHKAKHGTQLLVTANGNGGAAPQVSTAPKTPHAPIKARHPNLTYTGPVYELTATGEVVPYQPPTAQQALDEGTGGSVSGTVAGASTKLLVPGRLARYVDGLAAAPLEAPEAVKDIIWAGNELIGLPYIYGGGHASWHSPGYDCSGTVSYALHGAELLLAPEDSSELEAFGSHGIGEWVTVFANPGHAYMDVAGLRLDTSAADDPSNQQGPRWRPLRQGNAGYTIRHPLGL